MLRYLKAQRERRAAEGSLEQGVPSKADGTHFNDGPADLRRWVWFRLDVETEGTVKQLKYLLTRINEEGA